MRGPFVSEGSTDCGVGTNRDAMRTGVETVERQLGVERLLVVAGERPSTGQAIESIDPGAPSQMAWRVDEARAGDAGDAFRAAHDRAATDAKPIGERWY